MTSSSKPIKELFAESEICRLFIETSPDAIIIVAPDGEILEYNDKALKLFGYENFIDIPKNSKRLYDDPSDRDELLENLRIHGLVQDYETEFLTRSGEKITASVNVSVSNLGGNQVHIAIVRDISARKRAEEQLRRSEDKFSSLFDASSDAVLIFDENGCVVACNRAAVSFFNTSKEEIINNYFVDFCSLVKLKNCSSSSAIFAEHFSKVIKGGRSSFFWKYELNNGESLNCSVSLSSVEVRDEQLIMCVICDVGEQQRLQARMKIDEIRFEALSALSKMHDASSESLYNYALEAAVSVTGSQIGYIYFLSDDEKILTLHAWSKGVMPRCSVKEIPDSYNIDEIGIWGDAIRLRKPTITNDYESYPHKKGVPAGHVPVVRHMNVPLIVDGKIVLLAGVGNKKADYTEEDIRQTTLLMEGMWNVVCRKKADDALRTAYAGMERKVFDRTEKLSLALENLKQKNAEIEREVESRREIEKELKISAGRLSLATQAGGIGVWEWDLGSGVLVWDERMREMYRSDPDKFENGYEAWRSRVYPDDLAGAEKALNEAIETGIRFACEFRIIWPDGEIRHLIARGLGLYDEDKKIKSMIGINVDVTERRRLEARLRRFQRIISVTPDMVSLVSSDYKYVMVNDSYIKSFGKPRDYFVGKPLKDILGKNIFENHSKARIDAAFAGKTQMLESWLNVPLLGQRFFSVTYQLVDSVEDDERFVAIAAHDVTAMKVAEEDRRHIFQVSLDMLSVADFSGRFLEINPAWRKTLGWSESELKNKRWIELVHADDKDAFAELLENLLSGAGVRNYESRVMCKDGSWRWISWSLHADLDQEKITAVARDVSMQKKMMDDLTRMASTDPLTGAHNRRFFFERAKEEIDRCRRYGGNLCLIMLDIDHFKMINDTYGHDIGDVVLKELVHCSNATLRTSDVFARIGGEEFAALLVQGSKESAMQVAERLRLALSQLEVNTEKDIIQFTVSIGLTWVSCADTSIEQAMKQADRCLYLAKEEGRNRVISHC